MDLRDPAKPVYTVLYSPSSTASSFQALQTPLSPPAKTFVRTHSLPHSTPYIPHFALLFTPRSPA